MFTRVTRDIKKAIKIFYATGNMVSLGLFGTISAIVNKEYGVVWGD